MAEKPNFQCYHHTTHEPLTGEGSRFSLPIQRALVIGTLVCTGRFGGVCDNRVPVQESFFNGQDIGCVGPNDPACPDPSIAQIIQIGETKN